MTRIEYLMQKYEHKLNDCENQLQSYRKGTIESLEGGDFSNISTYTIYIEILEAKIQELEDIIQELRFFEEDLNGVKKED